MDRRSSSRETFALHTANPGDRVALRGVRLVGRLAGMSYQATLEQTFVNLERHAIEAVYTFPLPEGAAVCGFEVITADRVLTGTIEETERAIEKYEDAIAEGHGALMVEQDRPDVFTARVGNLKPRQAATIRLTFVGPLEIADKSIRVAFPTTVAPRFVTDSGVKDPLDAQIDGDALNPPHVLSVPYGLTMKLDVSLGRRVREIASPTHAITVGDEEDKHVVTFAGGVAEMDRDFVLTIATAKEHRPVAQAAHGPDGADYVTVTFVPEFDAADLGSPAATETIFLLDCSGSMQGQSIAQATAALELCLRSLNEGDTFNLCRFGSNFQLMSSEPLRYDDATLNRAVQWVRSSPDLGGTELYAPLEAILSKPPVVGAARTVIVLTDGQVTNEPAVVDLARKHRAHNRIFSFGIGSACSQFLVKGLARATGGAAEFISGAERIEEKVLRTFSRVGSPLVGDVAVDWGGADVQTLAEIPPVFDGDVLTVFGRCGGRLPESVSLRCVTPSGPQQWAVRVPQAAEDGNLVARMWARRTIQSLEEVNGVRRTSVSDRRESKAKQELVRLSKQFGLICSLTTFMAIEHRSLEERNEGRPALRRVPVKLAKGWGDLGAGTMLAGFVGVVSAAAPTVRSMDRLCDAKRRGGPTPQIPVGGAVPMAPRYAQGPTVDKTLDRGSALTDKTLDRSLDRSVDPSVDRPLRAKQGWWDKLAQLRRRRKTSQSAAPVPPSSPVTGPTQPAAEPLVQDDLTSLLMTQTASGSFGVPAERIRQIFQRAGVPLKDWETAIHETISRYSGDDHERITRTLEVLALLRLVFPEAEPIWRKAAQKALRFVGLAMGMSASDVETRLRDLMPAAQKS